MRENATGVDISNFAKKSSWLAYNQMLVNQFQKNLKNVPKFERFEK